MSLLLHFYLLFCVICFAPMRFPRVKAEGRSFYHCVSRVVDRQFIFQTSCHGSPEAERFVPSLLSPLQLLAVSAIPEPQADLPPPTRSNSSSRLGQVQIAGAPEVGPCKAVPPDSTAKLFGILGSFNEVGALCCKLTERGKRESRPKKFLRPGNKKLSQPV